MRLVKSSSKNELRCAALSNHATLRGKIHRQLGCWFINSLRFESLLSSAIAPVRVPQRERLKADTLGVLLNVPDSH